MVFEGSGENLQFVQEENYYPFGMKREGYDLIETDYSLDKHTRNQYNGIEKTEDLGKHLSLAHYRLHDASVARWFQIDPVATKYGGQSPYNSMFNDPVALSDPMGDDPAGIIIGAGVGLLASGIYVAANAGNLEPGEGSAIVLGGIVAGGLLGAGISATGGDFVQPYSGGYRPGRPHNGGTQSFLDFWIRDLLSGTLTRISDAGGDKTDYVLNKLGDTYLGLDVLEVAQSDRIGLVSMQGTMSSPGSRVHTFPESQAILDVGDPLTDFGPSIFKFAFKLLFSSVKSLVGSAVRTSKPLYHYTSEAGYNAIMKSKSLNPSIGLKNARHGTGQYFTDIAPGAFTRGQTSYRLYGVPGKKISLTHYIKIETSGLNIIKNKPYNFLNPSTTPLNLNGRILGGGQSIFK